MKTIIICIYLLVANILAASNFEVKVAISLNDCINCSNYLYSLNNLSKKYKITLLLSKDAVEDSAYAMEEIIGSKVKNYEVVFSDSLYRLYSHKLQNFLTAFKNEKIILSTLLKNINSKIDTLNELSFEGGDTISLNFKCDRQLNSAVKNHKLYLLNKMTNNLVITNLINSKSYSLNLNRQLLEESFRKNFNGSIEELAIAERYFKTINEKMPFKITSFFADDNKLYLMAFSEFLEFKLVNNVLDTIINPLISLLVYEKDVANPVIYPLTNKLFNKDYSFWELGFKVIGNKLLINVMKNNIDNKNQENKWICKCQLSEKIYLDTTDCIPLPKMHKELGLGYNFAQYVLDNDYLINTVTNELVNHNTKKVTELKFPFSKIKVNNLKSFDVEQKYLISDVKVISNTVRLLYYNDSLYKYLSYNILTNKIIENYTIENEFKKMKTPPQFFSDNLYYYISKGSTSVILKEIKPL